MHRPEENDRAGVGNWLGSKALKKNHEKSREVLRQNETASLSSSYPECRTLVGEGNVKRI